MSISINKTAVVKYKSSFRSRQIPVVYEIIPLDDKIPCGRRAPTSNKLEQWFKPQVLIIPIATLHNNPLFDITGY